MSIGRMSIVPEAEYDLTELEQLDLSDMYLEELPKSINKLKKSQNAGIRQQPIQRT